MDFTKEQEQAIFTRGSDILVSAGAGAGKTRVLVTRISELIVDPDNPVSADQLLVLTFTNAAAREMKERISKELEERLEKNPEDRRLRQQIRVVKHADISTVHSFCNHLIRTHFNELGIDPSFRIGEDGELKAMKKEAMDTLLEECYMESSEDFLSLVEAYAPGRDDDFLEEMVEKIYRFSRGFANADGWFRKTEEDFLSLTTEEGMERNPAICQTVEQAKKQIRQLYDLTEAALRRTEDVPDQERLTGFLRDDLMQLNTLLSADTFQDIYEKLHQVSFGGSGFRGRKAETAWPYFKAVKDGRKKVMDAIKDMAGTSFLKSPAQIRIEQKKLYPLFKECISMVQRYAEIYAAIKAEKNIYEFDDLERFALRLLVDHYDEEGAPVATEAAREIASRYRAIFVDEYQDTSMVQETILTVLHNVGDNTLFTVGDVKQSIYRFRQARPDLFLQRYERYEAGEGVKIELRDNFRSSPDVLDFCNQFFTRWMKKDFGGIDYDENVCLVAGQNGPMHELRVRQEALLLMKDGEDSGGSEDLGDTLSEAVMIGRRIETLLQEGYHYDDMVILLRSIKNRGQIIADYLESCHIPVLCESQTGYFQTREIQVILNYLSVIDNVYLDIPMASVMLSVIGHFTADDLARLKIVVDPSMRRDYSLYELMNLYLTEGDKPELMDKIRAFLGQLSEFRRKKQKMLLHELIWDIYEETGFYEEVLAMHHGEKRRENLMILLKHAETYEKTMFKGLFYFIRHMEQLRTYEVEPGGNPAQDSAQNAVKIMTIHKSKGLEFPVVFVSTLTKRFNSMDLSAKILFHPELGIGMDVFDLEARTYSMSLLKNAIQKRMKKEMLEEELRILYVAMTRAQKKLILTGVVSEKKAEELEENTYFAADQAKNFLDWILPVVYDDGNWTNCSRYHLHEIMAAFGETAPSGEQITLEDILKDPDVLSANAEPVAHAFSRVYPHEESISWKRKYSVSELKKIAMQLGTESGEEPLIKEYQDSEDEVPKPRFLQEETEEIRGTTYGTIVHKVMELLPFGEIDSHARLFKELEKIWPMYPEFPVSSRKKVYKAMETFFDSEYGKIISGMDRQGQLHKEWPFTVGLDASYVYPDTVGGDMIVLQGIIDSYGETEEGIWLIDYKTDRVKDGQEDLLLDRYKTQMLYYKLALEQMLEKKVCHTLIYSFALQRFLEIDWEEQA